MSVTERARRIRAIEDDAGSSSWEVRVGAAEALADLGYAADVDAVLRRLLLDADDTGVTVRAAAVAIGFHDPGALAVLVAAYRDGEEETGWHIAIQVAAEVGNAFTRATLTAFRDDPELASAVVELEEQLGWMPRA